MSGAFSRTAVILRMLFFLVLTRIASLLKRWLLGTHQGAVRYEHLDYYLDEYTFRFNRRSSKARGLLFHRLVEQAVQIKPTTYRGIVGGAAKAGHHHD